MGTNNATSKYSTHFLRGVDIVRLARKHYNIPSENWTYPTKHKYGYVNGMYYAELWHDGMDWQSSYWLIEKVDYNKPRITPFIIFDNDTSNVYKYIEHDFDGLFDAICWYRQDMFWIKKDPVSYYSDEPWAFINGTGNTKDAGDSKYKLKQYYFEHASQPKVDFWIMDEMLIPKQFRGIRKSTNTMTSENMTITTDFAHQIPNG